MATTNDADIVLKLYDLRREEVMRKARKFVAFEFTPADFGEFMEVVRGMTSDKSAYFRQVTTFWEMAAGLALRGAVDRDLYMDSNGEGIFIYTKFQSFHAEYAQTMGFPFMAHTAELIATFGRAAQAHTKMSAMLAK